MPTDAKITMNTTVNFAVLVAIVFTAVQFWVKLTRIESDLAAIRTEINSRMADRWTATMQGVWAREVMTLNPDFKTPSVEDICRRFPPNTIKEKE